MWRLAVRMLIVLTAIVASPGVVRSQDQGTGKQCRPGTLKGSYVFAATGFNIVGGVPVPKAIVELIDFNGDGTLTVPGGTVTVNGAIAQIAPGGVGDYTLERDCTGTITFIPGPTFNIFLEPHGKSGWMIQTTPNTVFQGTLTLLHR